MGDTPLLGTPRTVAVLRSPQTSSVMLCLVVLSPKPWIEMLGLQGSLRAARGLTFNSPASLQTAVAHYYVGTAATQNLGVAKGQILELLSGRHDSDPAKSENASRPADAPASVVGTTPVSQSKLWASLFYDFKPSSFSPMASVETISSCYITLVSEKQAEVTEGLVQVSEDPVAIKIAGLLENVTLIHKAISLQPCGLINKGN